MRTLTPLLIVGYLLIPVSECLARIAKVNVVRTTGQDVATIDADSSALAASASADGAVAVGGSCGLVGEDVDVDFLEKTCDVWSCAPGGASSFDRIEIAVGKDDQLMELDPYNPPLFICGEEIAVGVYKDHEKWVNDDPDLPHHEVWSADFEGECDGKVEVYLQPAEPGTHPFIKDVSFSVTAPDCPTIVIAVVLDIGQVIDTLEVVLDGKPVDLGTQVSQPHQKLLADALEDVGLFDPEGEQELFFWVFIPRTACGSVFQLVVTYRVATPDKYCQGGQFEGHPCTDHDDCDGPYCEPEEVFFPARFVGGGTSLADLFYAELTGEMSFFMGVDVQVVDLTGIPTVSTWGLIVMTLLLLVGAKTYFGRRRKVASS